MALLTPGMSSVVSFIVSIGMFSGLQLYRTTLAATGPGTFAGGALSAGLFMFLLTGLGNLETLVFGKGYTAGIFPEVFICLILALITAARIHGVCITTCFLFSIVSLYYMNRISQKEHGIPESSSAFSSAKKKK